MTAPAGPRGAGEPDPQTACERRLVVHADAYTPWPDTDPRCATCHRDDCPRYWRIQNRLDRDQAAQRASRPPATYQEPPW